MTRHQNFAFILQLTFATFRHLLLHNKTKKERVL